MPSASAFLPRVEPIPCPAETARLATLARSGRAWAFVPLTLRCAQAIVNSEMGGVSLLAFPFPFPFAVVSFRVSLVRTLSGGMCCGDQVQLSGVWPQIGGG
jgi:hypothetical protein